MLRWQVAVPVIASRRACSAEGPQDGDLGEPDGIRDSNAEEEGPRRMPGRAAGEIKPEALICSSLSRARAADVIIAAGSFKAPAAGARAVTASVVWRSAATRTDAGIVAAKSRSFCRGTAGFKLMLLAFHLN
mmetsp:Transcript_75982/g.180743  ORF Transcript_75982/g.180743 Transcript_75982/m.180743 type:complete len:132 (+) Transcript_75982:843-1238(+)